MYFFSADAAEDSGERHMNETSRRNMPDHVCNGAPRAFAMLANLSGVLWLLKGCGCVLTECDSMRGLSFLLFGARSADLLRRYNMVAGPASGKIDWKLEQLVTSTMSK
jgi:hypothetical protein